MILNRLLVAGSDGGKLIFKDQPPDVGPQCAITGGLFQGFSLLLSKADTEGRRLLFPIVCHNANSLVKSAAILENTCK